MLFRFVATIMAMCLTLMVQAFELRTEEDVINPTSASELSTSQPPLLQRAVVPQSIIPASEPESVEVLDMITSDVTDEVATGEWLIDRVEVKKSTRRMFLMAGDTVIKEYRISLGPNPRGHKVQEGDNRTPEGKYYLDFVMNDSAFYRSMHISYPNLRDKRNAKDLGVSAGGNIKIHGLKNGYTKPEQFIQSFDWTNGCIAITNTEMDELITLVKIGTPIYIRW